MSSFRLSQVAFPKRFNAFPALLLTVALLLVAFSAEGQRRRRRRRPPRPPVEVVAPAETPEATEAPLSEPPGPAGAEEPIVSEPESQQAPPARPPRVAALSSVPLAELQQEYTEMMDELVQLRSRTAVLAGQLFDTRVRVVVVNETDDESVLQRVRLSLDGAPVFQGETNAVGDNEREVFEGALAPGFHLFGVELEQQQRANREFRYTLRDDYRFKIAQRSVTELRLVIEDDSDVAEAFEDNDDEEAEGAYDVRTKLQVRRTEGSNT